ncbi:hypothetical protein MKK69_13575 [Methylobacterium sp. J-026]|uniref:hypothetical protein n=1 Tax=Methylobacterium sp. J-026 TaxID=2836624 RepID=UPI001FB9CCFE|nr:hypothetical protein [Methylobacterium sp. J-026]MCJ2135076.1 hypothetical protein [Methylobacterium sp. J-026]
MNELEERRRDLLRNLALHASLARRRMSLSLTDAARLAGLTPEGLITVERGAVCPLSLAAVEQLTLFLGLTACGLPRPRPAGMQ